MVMPLAEPVNFCTYVSADIPATDQRARLPGREGRTWLVPFDGSVGRERDEYYQGIGRAEMIDPPCNSRSDI